VEAQSRTAAGACGKPLAAGIMVIQTAVFRHDLHSALSTGVKGRGLNGYMRRWNHTSAVRWKWSTELAGTDRLSLPTATVLNQAV
jgi:hypothetical protein